MVLKTKRIFEKVFVQTAREINSLKYLRTSQNFIPPIQNIAVSGVTKCPKIYWTKIKFEFANSIRSTHNFPIIFVGVHYFAIIFVARVCPPIWSYEMQKNKINFNSNPFSHHLWLYDIIYTLTARVHPTTKDWIRNIIINISRIEHIKSYTHESISIVWWWRLRHFNYIEDWPTFDGII